MGRDAKIRFEQQELEVISDPLPFLIRQQVMPKMTKLLAQWMETLKASPAYQSFPYPTGTDTAVGNIARGERLQGCPYLIADLPRLFHHSGHFAFRTLFWWGHHFTFFWHVSGKQLESFGRKLMENLHTLPSSTRISFLGNEWEHDLAADNYQSIDETDQSISWQQAQESGFVKLALALELERWEELDKVGQAFFEATTKTMTE